MLSSLINYHASLQVLHNDPSRVSILNAFRMTLDFIYYHCNYNYRVFFSRSFFKQIGGNPISHIGALTLLTAISKNENTEMNYLHMAVRIC